MGPNGCRSAYPRFIRMKQMRIFSPLDEMLVHLRVTLQQYVTFTHLYTWVERDIMELFFFLKETK